MSYFFANVAVSATEGNCAAVTVDSNNLNDLVWRATEIARALREGARVNVEVEIASYEIQDGKIVELGRIAA